jgi:hypothetical protein
VIVLAHKRLPVVDTTQALPLVVVPALKGAVLTFREAVRHKTELLLELSPLLTSGEVLDLPHRPRQAYILAAEPGTDPTYLFLLHSITS